MTELQLGLKLMLFGLGSVFAALILFYTLIKILNKLFPPVEVNKK
jgi:Na+-transporting methylmalonyl-CoA/oxaloacetate decarboxylase gamma subunit